MHHTDLLAERCSRTSRQPLAAPVLRMCVLLGVCLLTLLGGAAQAAEPAPTEPAISYPDFASTSGLQLNGVAASANSALRLTPAEKNKSGTTFSRTEIQPAGSFEAEFEIRMHESNTIEAGTFGFPADGIAFVLQPKAAEAVGTVGGALGYAGIAPSAEVQFDIYQDLFYKPEDPPVPYVSFMEGGDPEVHLATSEAPLGGGFQLYGETPVEAWVDYDATAHQLSVYAVPAPEAKPATPLFTYSVNLAEVLGGEFTFVGFTAGTGAGDAVQEVLDWRLSSELPTRFVPPPPPAPVPASSSPSSTQSVPSAHVTTTRLTCALVVASASNTCTATVADAAVSGASNPAGPVSFKSAAGGAFGAGGNCVLVPTPASASSSSCAAQFSAPTGASPAPSLTATYGGDANHGASVGAGAYVPSRELGKDVSFSPSVTLSADGKQADVTFFCHFACSVLGELTSGSNFVAETATVKRVPLGKGVLKLGKPAKGELRVALSSKARKALAKAAGRPVKGILEITVYTASGTLVKRERKTVTIRPRAGKATVTRG